MVRIISLVSRVLCALVAALSTCHVNADTRATAEYVALGAVAYGVRDYQFNHNGQTPTNWAQISEFRDIAAINRGTFPITDHYAFVRQDKIPLPNSEKGDVFLIRLSPATNIMHPEGGRYIISLAGGSPLLNWLSETNVQKMLADAGVTELPKPEPLNQSTNSGVIRPVGDVNSLPTTNAVRTAPRAESVRRAPTITQPVAEPTPTAPVETQPTPQAASAADPSSFAKKLVVVLAVVLGLAAAFVLFRPRK